MESNERLGALLKELRGKRSLRDAEKITGLSYTYISDLEKGYRRSNKKPIKPSIDTLKRISKAYMYSYTNLLEAAGYIDELEKIELPNDDFAETAKRIAALREEKNLSLSEVAEQLQLDESTYSKIEDAKIEPTGMILKKIASLYYVSTDYLLGLTDSKNWHSQIEGSDFVKSFEESPSAQKFVSELTESNIKDLEKLEQLWRVMHEK
ncbi:helix-turn-helix domain-containing protein [Listeria booriae]|uniref:helix-turn-helix domain-containing protein n=1 Tax=Listeria booriae TaxID=1552123 RepID=UPI001625E525|nr:helix-turn-helix transcriptional regulator [Listeria booriae]MBC1801077.1 transcriptional regulator [Listeria booriae]